MFHRMMGDVGLSWARNFSLFGRLSICRLCSSNLHLSAVVPRSLCPGHPPVPVIEWRIHLQVPASAAGQSTGALAAAELSPAPTRGMNNPQFCSPWVPTPCTSPTAMLGSPAVCPSTTAPQYRRRGHSPHVAPQRQAPATPAWLWCRSPALTRSGAVSSELLLPAPSATSCP